MGDAEHGVGQTHIPCCGPHRIRAVPRSNCNPEPPLLHRPQGEGSSADLRRWLRAIGGGLATDAALGKKGVVGWLRRARAPAFRRPKGAGVQSAHDTFLVIRAQRIQVRMPRARRNCAARVLAPFRSGASLSRRHGHMSGPAQSG